MRFHTVSALLRHNWLIEPGYAAAQLPLVMEILKNAGTHSPKLYDDGDGKAKTPPPQQCHISVVAQTPLYSVGYYNSLDSLPQGCIAMVDIIGPVLKYGDLCSYGSVDQANLLNKIANNSRIAGIILNVDSPGGQADGTATLADTIKQIQSVKPVIAVIQDGMAASAGYWIASAAQEIYATQVTDMFGSIGAYTTFYDLKGYLEKLGVRLLEIYAPQSDDKNKGYRDAIAGDETLIKEDLKFLVDQFIGTVKTNRGPRLKTAAGDPFTGKLFNAKDALKIGLIDGIKPLAGVVARMEQLIKLRA